MKGWIDIETAADRLAHHSRQKVFRELPKSEAKKVLRELRDLVVAGIVQAQLEVEGDELRYRQLTTSDALAPPFGIHFEIDKSLGAETIFAPGVLRPMLLREADFAALPLAPPVPPAPLDDWLEFKDLRAKGVRIGKSQIRRLEAEGKFPGRRYQTTRKPVWPANEIDAWVANPKNGAI